MDTGFATGGASTLQPGVLTSCPLGPSACVWVRGPLPALAPFVDLFVYAENRVSPGTVSTFDLFPGPCPWLVFQLETPLVSTGKAWNGRRVVLPRAGASGFFDFPMTSTGYGPTTDISVRIKPEAASLLLGTGNDELRNAHLDLADLWGREADVALERASSASSREDAVAAIEQALLGRVAHLSQPRADLRAAVASLRSYGGSKSVSLTSAQLGMTTRNLNLIFRRHVGISPKRFARLARFSRVVNGISLRGRSRWRSDIPEEFFDEAHFIKEFKAHSGLTPFDFARSVGRGPAPQVMTFPDRTPRADPGGFLGEYGIVLVRAR